MKPLSKQERWSLAARGNFWLSRENLPPRYYHKKGANLHRRLEIQRLLRRIMCLTRNIPYE